MHRKFKAEHIFNGYELIPGSQVIITDQQGTVIDIVDEGLAGADLQVMRGILSPGFVNAHCHLELSHLKGIIGEKTGLVDFVLQVMNRRGDAGPNAEALNEMKQEAMSKADQELFDGGTVAVGDICNTTDSILVKTKTKIRWKNFIEVSGFVDATADQRLEAIEPVHDAFLKQFGHEDVVYAPHAPYSVSKTLFKKLNALTKGCNITIHNQEALAEDVLYYSKEGDFLGLYKNLGIDIIDFAATGKSSLQSWLPYFDEHQSVIAVHNTFTSQADIEFAANWVSAGYLENIFYCVCVNANRYIEQAFPPIDLLQDLGANIIIGTDSYASNWQLNIFEELKAIQAGNKSDISLQQLLRWATINGAVALGFQETLGSFEIGKRPGILLIEGLDNLKLTWASSVRRVL